NTETHPLHRSPSRQMHPETGAAGAQWKQSTGFLQISALNRHKALQSTASEKLLAASVQVQATHQLSESQCTLLTPVGKQVLNQETAVLFFLSRKPPKPAGVFAVQLHWPPHAPPAPVQEKDP